MSKQYGGFLTDKGAAKQIEAAAGGLRRDITHMLIGDGGGAPGETPDPVPSPSQTALIRQRYRVKLNRLVAAEDSPSVLVAEAILPQEVGGLVDARAGTGGFRWRPDRCSGLCA